VAKIASVAAQRMCPSNEKQKNPAKIIRFSIVRILEKTDKKQANCGLIKNTT
jgi:hypothetical protein